MKNAALLAEQEGKVIDALKTIAKEWWPQLDPRAQARYTHERPYRPCVHVGKVLNQSGLSVTEFNATVSRLLRAGRLSRYQYDREFVVLTGY